MGFENFEDFFPHIMLTEYLKFLQSFNILRKSKSFEKPKFFETLENPKIFEIRHTKFKFAFVTVLDPKAFQITFPFWLPTALTKYSSIVISRLLMHFEGQSTFDPWIFCLHAIF